MAKELENEETKLTKEEIKEAKLKEKKEKAQAKKKELEEQIEEIKAKILDENDEKEKKKLRKQRDTLIAEKDGIVINKGEVKVPLAPSVKSKIKACVAVVLIVSLLLGYIATGAARHGIMSSLGVPQKALTGLVLTDNEGKAHPIKVATYNYYFAAYYNQLNQMQSYISQLGTSGESVDFSKKFSEQTRKDDDGKTQTWAEYMEDTVIDNIKGTYSYYFAALKANDGKEPEIKDSQKEELEDTIKTIKENADKYGYTISAYLTAAYGYGVDEALFRKESKITYIANNYQEDYKKELNSKEFTDKEYKKYLKENRADLVSVDVKFFECSNEDDAKSFVKALNSDGSNFAELASKYSEDDYDKKANKNPVETTYKNMTRSVFQNMNAAIGTSDKAEDGTETYIGLDWLYSKNRKAGEAKNFSTSVVYIIKPAYLSELKTVNVRHILVKPVEEKKEGEEDEVETDNDITMATATADQKKAAKKKADDILAEYKKGKKNAEAFGALAKKYTDDSNGDDGGLYENVTPNQMVSTFNEWIFDSSRKAGDTAIVETEHGYHVMYFESKGKMEAWKYTAQQALASKDTDSVIEEFEDKNKIKKSWPGSCFFEIDTDIDNG